MRLLILCLLLAVTACSREMSDDEFRIAEQTPDRGCFASITDAIHPLIEAIDLPSRGRERGVEELRVTQRDQRTFVVDLRRWDSGDEGRGFFRERLLFERLDAAIVENGTDDAQWCHTNSMQRAER